MGDEPALNLCAECARRGETCCQQVEIFVTRGDVTRISDFTGVTDFCEWRQPEDPNEFDPEDDPLWFRGAIRADGRRRLIRQRDNGDCLFLGDSGCRLPLQVRPLTCRLYPFDYGEEGLRDIISRYCPTDLLPEGTELVETLGMREDRADQWREMLYEELRRELAGL